MGGKGAMVNEQISSTLSCGNTQTLFAPKLLKVYGISSYDSNGMKSSNPHSGIYEAETSRTIDTSGGTPAHNQGGMMIVDGNEEYVVRRLTERECERLQAYPDGWITVQPIPYDEIPFWRKVWDKWCDVSGIKRKTDKQIAKWMRSPNSSAAQYKALGNSIGLPFWHWMFKNMAEYLPENATLGSLFDGIGGFPRCWEMIHGENTAVWSSEIEPFPIAVSSQRFGNAEIGRDGDHLKVFSERRKL